MIINKVKIFILTNVFKIFLFDCTANKNCKEKININKQKPHRIYEESAKWIKFKTGNIPAIKTVARSKINVINTILRF